MIDLKGKYLVILSLLLFFSCKTTDWYENYKEKRKSPFGTYILHQEASDLFEGNKVENLKKNIYDYLIDDEYGDYDYLDKTYVLIKASANKLDHSGLDELLNFVGSGNTAFLALNKFPDSLEIKLGFKTKSLDSLTYSNAKLKELNGEFNIHKENELKIFSYDRTVRRHYFESYEENTTKILGNSEIESELVPNFIKIEYGEGEFYLHSNPVAFTNYYLLKPSNKTYAEQVFSYLPNRDVLWDLHIKSSTYKYEYEGEGDGDDSESIFKFFFEHETLTWALWLSFVGLLLFMLFNARRKQRAIPVITPLKNSTVEFAQSISYLYLSGKDHNNVIEKMTTYFLEQVRTRYLLNTSNLNENFIKKLALKSGNTLESTNYLINTIIHFNKKMECDETNVIVLHNMIKKFFKT